MGRLFWKFFAFVWLAQLAGIIAVGSLFWLTDHRSDPAATSVATASPRWSVNQNRLPTAMMPANCASHTKPKNFQNSLPTLFLEKLVALTVHRLDAGAPVRQGAQLATYTAYVHVDASVVSREGPPEGMFG